MKSDDKLLDFIDNHPVAFVCLATVACILFALVVIAVGGMAVQLIGSLF